jgi:hypothetical protein
LTYTELLGGAYKTRTLVSAAQRCLNLYLEKTPVSRTAGTGEPTPNSHNVTPGTRRLSVAPQERIRALYRATSGKLYGVAGQDLYYISPDWVWHQVGHIQPSKPSTAVPRTTPVSIVDSGIDAVLVDGTSDGWHWNPQDNTGWARLTDDGFKGSQRVEYLDTFFILSEPDSPRWYVSGSGATTFAGDDVVSRAAFGDNSVAVVASRRSLTLIGNVSTEFWANTGGGGLGTTTSGTEVNVFPFSITANYHDVGCAAVYSIAKISDVILWLAQDVAGNCTVVAASGFTVTRVSTHSIETEFSTYSNIADATGYCYQQQGHQFYVLNFTEADKTWVYDIITGEWHERCWLDANGNEHRHRGNYCAFAYGKIVVGDWETGDLYQLDLNTYTDATPGGSGNGPIKRLRSFPHMIDTGMNKRVFYRTLIANMAVGTSKNTQASETVVDTSFVAADGTLLESYSNVADTNGHFIKIIGQGQVVDDSFIATDSGITAYQTATPPTVNNYAVQFTVDLTDGTLKPPPGSYMFAIGRGINLNQGYRAAVTSTGTAYTIDLTVLPATVSVLTLPLGAMMDGGFRVTLDMQGTGISVAVQRMADQLWLDHVGAWTPIKVTAIRTTDHTYVGPGLVFFGGNWLQTPTVGPPPAAMMAGFTGLVFEDDFTDPGTISPTP